MKKSLLLVLTPAIFISLISLQKSSDFKIEKYFAKNGHKNANGAPTGRTGAPGEGNCTGCHAGTAQNGSSENLFILLNGLTQVTSYVPGTVYNATLTMSSNPAKKGFQAIALSPSNTMAGSFTGQASNTAITTAGSKKYANHTSASNTSSVSTWVWTWTAPAADVGDVTFYVATNKANDNNNDSGDIIYLSQHIIGSTAGIEEEEVKQKFEAGYSSENNSVEISFNTLSSGLLYFNLVDLNGRSVFTYELGAAQIGENKQSIKLPSEIKNGIYVVNLFINNNVKSAKVMVQR